MQAIFWLKTFNFFYLYRVNLELHVTAAYIKLYLFKTPELDDKLKVSIDV